MMQAKIECPHCGGSITVRARDSEAEAMAEQAERLSAESDKIFASFNKAFRAVFDKPLWRRGRV